MTDVESLVAAILATGTNLRAMTGPLGAALGSLGGKRPKELDDALFAHRDAVLAYVMEHGTERRYGGSLTYVLDGMPQDASGRESVTNHTNARNAPVNGVLGPQNAESGHCGDGED